MPRRPYPGNGPGKRLARHELYRLARKHLPDRAGQVITLAGPQAPEVPYLRDLLRHPAEATWFIDVDAACLRDAIVQWPSVQTFHGNISEAILGLIPTPLRFVNLDFMGQYTYRAAACVRLVAERCHPGAIVALTYKRGMELSTQEHTKRILRLGRHGTTFAEKRLRGIHAAFREDLRGTRNRVETLDVIEYRHNGSAMTNVIVQVR